MENLYKFKVFGARKVVHEFSEKGWNVKRLSNLLKKLHDSGLMTRRTGSGRRCSVRCHASLVLQGTVRTYKTGYKSARVYLFVSNFLRYVSAKN